ncbi:unnamed protein product [Adineta steineri]|uniref:F-box domain-containing protein n=1 Tax=Adineta steineri TaxID=433720 RepID=A0A813VE64_9BILA|nr:unnamed protein product [Adineta steineri]CAF3980664.1 unnamed protein product [Adineta steineri]
MENLPNELFFQIFNYLQPEDLFKAFGNLNSHFSALIRSTFIRFCVTDDNVTLLSMITADQIKSMICNETTNFHLLINYFKNNHFIQLQRLNVTLVQTRSIRTLLEYLPQLNNLKLLRIVDYTNKQKENSKNFYHSIAQLIFTKPYVIRLKCIELFIPNMIPYYGHMPRPNPLPILTYFTIHSIFLDDLAIILPWMPNIKTIKILYACITNDDDGVGSGGLFHEHDLTCRSLMRMPPIVSIQKFDIGICDGVTCKHMQLLLSNLPELRRFNCVIWSKHALILEQWIPIFLRKVSGGICLEAHGMNILRRSVANELDNESLNEQPRKKQRTN